MRRRTLLGLAAAALVLTRPTRRPTAASGVPAPSPSPDPGGPASAGAPIDTRAERHVAHPGRRGGIAEAIDVIRTSVRTALRDNLTDQAAALAYYAFLAIPAVLLVAVGVFGVVAEPGTIDGLIDRLEGVVPAEALTLIDDTLTRVTERPGGGLGLAITGLVLALWTASGAMSALMRGLNRVRARTETRSFARQRLTALALLGWSVLAALMSFGLLVLGAPLSAELGDALDAPGLVATLWWTAQWPILLGALLAAVLAILRAGPDGPRFHLRAELSGGGVAVGIWVVASAGFAIYAARFGSYGAAWGSLSAVIVMLTWLWLTGLALLLGAQVAAEVDRRTLG